MLVSDSHQIRKYIRSFTKKVHWIFLENTYCLCNFSKLFEESDCAPRPIVSLPRINLLKHILPLIERHRTPVLVPIVEQTQLFVIDSTDPLNKFAVRIAMRGQTAVGT